MRMMSLSLSLKSLPSNGCEIARQNWGKGITKNSTILCYNIMQDVYRTESIYSIIVIYRSWISFRVGFQFIQFCVHARLHGTDAAYAVIPTSNDRCLFWTPIWQNGKWPNIFIHLIMNLSLTYSYNNNVPYANLRRPSRAKHFGTFHFSKFSQITGQRYPTHSDEGSERVRALVYIILLLLLLLFSTQNVIDVVVKTNIWHQYIGAFLYFVYLQFSSRLYIYPATLTKYTHFSSMQLRNRTPLD